MIPLYTIVLCCTTTAMSVPPAFQINYSPSAFAPPPGEIVYANFSPDWIGDWGVISRICGRIYSLYLYIASLAAPSTEGGWGFLIYSFNKHFNKYHAYKHAFRISQGSVPLFGWGRREGGGRWHRMVKIICTRLIAWLNTLAYNMKL